MSKNDICWRSELSWSHWIAQVFLPISHFQNSWITHIVLFIINRDNNSACRQSHIPINQIVYSKTFFTAYRWATVQSYSSLQYCDCNFKFIMINKVVGIVIIFILGATFIQYLYVSDFDFSYYRWKVQRETRYILNTKSEWLHVNEMEACLDADNIEKPICYSVFSAFFRREWNSVGYQLTHPADSRSSFT